LLRQTDLGGLGLGRQQGRNNHCFFGSILSEGAFSKSISAFFVINFNVMRHEEKSNPTNRQLIIYCATLFLLSWCVQIAAIIITGSANSPEARPWLVVTMLTPSVVTIVYLIVHPQLRIKLLWKPNWNIFRISFIAVLVPTITAFLVLLIIQQMNYGNSGWFRFSFTDVQISGGLSYWA
jgi:hypothetical protein